MNPQFLSPEWCAQTQECLSGNWHERLGQMAHWMWLHPFLAAFCVVLIFAAARNP